MRGICTIIVTFLLPRAVVGVGEVLDAGDLAFAQRRVAVDVDVRAVERAVAAVGGDVDDRAVVVADRERRSSAAVGAVGFATVGAAPREAGLAEAGGQQVVGGAVVDGLRDRADERRASR